MNPRTPPSAATLTFLGGAGTVTGSKYLVRAAGRQILLDCGLFQGLKPLRLRNWDRPPFDPRAIDAVVLSHAHLDHAGYLPILVRNGFRGSVHCTPATASLLPIVLRDSAHLQEEDARRANLYGYSKHHPALPLYSRVDVEATLPLLQTHPYGERFTVAGAFHVQFGRAGHILGSATISVDIGANPAVRLVYSGDLGRWGRPILRDPELVKDADILLIESTYGGRVHAGDPAERVATIITETARRGRCRHYSVVRNRADPGADLDDTGARRHGASATRVGVHRQPDGYRRHRHLLPASRGSRHRHAARKMAED